MSLWGPPSPWQAVDKFMPAAARLADGHYSRRTVGSPQFMPPGQTLVLLTADCSAVFGWWRPDPRSGIVAMNGLDGWTCTIFRNTGPRLSSELILGAEAELMAQYDCGPDGLLTYVWDAKVRSANPGYCFKVAGWKAIGRSADKRKTLLWKDAARAGLGPSAAIDPPRIADLAVLDWEDISGLPRERGLVRGTVETIEIELPATDTGGTP